MADAGSAPEASFAVRSSRRRFLTLSALGGVGTFLTACGTQQPTTAPSAAPPTRWGLIYLTIVAGKMLGKDDWSTYVPANFSLPAHATVDLQIVNLDHPHALGDRDPTVLEVRGTLENSITVALLDPVDPNALWAQAATITRIAPAQISHTFTIDTLGLNVPVAAGARTSFRLQTGAPGSHEWRCVVPCAVPPSRLGGSMATPGYMLGTLVVVE